MKSVLINGASRGLGLAFVKTFLDRNCRVYAGCRQPDTANFLHTLKQQYPHTLFMVKLDADDDVSISESRKIVAENSGCLDVLINNAAILIGGSGLLARSEDLLAMYRTNVVGSMLVIQAFVELLRNGHDAKVVNISSEAGSLEKYHNSLGICGYACTKSALNMATRCIAHELINDNIIVCSVYPGWLKTDMGSADADLSPEESALAIAENIIDKATMAHSGNFYTWEGTVCPW